MRACVTTGEKHRVECVEIEKPRVEPQKLLLKIKYACICGSDLEYLDGALDLVGRKSLRAGYIQGHEFVGEVVEIGEGVDGWKVGDRAVPGSNLAGWRPPPMPAHVPPRDYTSQSAFAEYTVVSKYGLQKVPEHVTDEEAVFVEPLCTGAGSVVGSGLKPGQSGAVIGVGKIGLLAVAVAKVAGASPVIAIDIHKDRLAKAEEMDADIVIDASETDPVPEVLQLTGDGVNAIIVCSRAGEVLNQAVEMGTRGAVIVLAGFVPPMEVNPMIWAFRQLRIVGVLGGPYGGGDMSALAMHLISRGQIDPKPLISEILPLEEVQRGIDSLYSGENIAVLLKP